MTRRWCNYLPGDVIRATVVRMTEFSPLGYIAALAALAAAIGYAYAIQAYPHLAAQSWLLVGVPLHMLLWTVGKLLGLGAWAGKCTAWLFYSLTELWGPRPVAAFLRRAIRSLDRYRRRQLVPARHAA